MTEQPERELPGYQGCRGLSQNIAEPPTAIQGVNMGSPVPREGKNSTEQQGTGDGCQTDRQWLDGLTPLAG